MARSLLHPYWPPSRRLLSISLALCALAIAIGACSLSPSSPSGHVSNNDTNGGSVSTGSGQTTPVKIIHGGGGSALVLIPIMIDGKGPYNFALDTGAGISLIDTDLANTLGLQESGSSFQVSGVGGSQDITPVHVDSWAAGSIKFPTADIGKTGLPTFKQESDVQGLLGSDILSQFGRVTINYDTGELSAWQGPAPQSYVAPAREWAAKIPNDSSGARAA